MKECMWSLIKATSSLKSLGSMDSWRWEEEEDEEEEEVEAINEEIREGRGCYGEWVTCVLVKQTPKLIGPSDSSTDDDTDKFRTIASHKRRELWTNASRNYLPPTP